MRCGLRRDEWVVDDGYGGRWRISIPPVTERETGAAYDWQKCGHLEMIIFNAFDDSRAREDHIAAALVEIYDTLTNSSIGDRLPVASQPSHDPGRILVGFDLELRHALLTSLRADFLRIEEVPGAPWPFTGSDETVQADEVEPHLDVPRETTAWIEIRLVDQDGKPVPKRRYVVTLPSGDTRSGMLDSEGRARIDGIDPGKCDVTFPKFDQYDHAPPTALKGQRRQLQGPPSQPPPSS